ncbi:MAG TPA: glycosyltransferase [Solirubrobacteraceae bacterium]|nr:glycosyltransferase [Solirubrobacteraceae bacterium]
MRLAIVAPLVSPIREPQVGGSQAFLANLARGLVDRGHDVHLYAASGSRVAGVEVLDTGVDHRALEATLYRTDGPGADGGAAAAAAFAAVYGAIAERDYDVVHNHAFDAPAITLVRGTEAPVVHTLHLPPDPGLTAALREASCDETPPMIACVSESQAAAWRAYVPVDALLAPYVPTRSIPFAASATPGALFAGRLSAEKGAAEAIDIARAAGLPIEVFGDPYDARYTREQIDPRTRLPGVSVHRAVARTELWEAMAHASVVLCPARWEEPFGMAAAEAQACGTPVVAFARGALCEVILDGVTGLLVAPEDIAGAAAAVLESASLSRRSCREHAVRELDLERTLDAHERVYERLASGAVRSPLRG